MDELRSTRDRVAEQYERYPYPASPFHQTLFARPVAYQAHPIAYELGQYLRTGRFVEHTKRTRILVAGSGALEPIVVAAAHPQAQILALDLSASTLSKLKRRAFFNGLSRRLECVQADLHEPLASALGEFDYIVCTGVLHHSPQPEFLLKNLAHRLKPEGLLRVMTYAATSRIWIYALQDFFHAQGLKPNRRLLADCQSALSALESRHPLRLAFETYSDSTNLAGLVDGFFHACDKPITALKLSLLSQNEGLDLLGFGHAWHSQPQALHQTLSGSPCAARFERLTPFEQLQTLDELGECAVNPIFWFSRTSENVSAGQPSSFYWNPTLREAPRALSISAPLMPLTGDLASPVMRARIEEAGALPSLRFFEAGWALGNDGRLPSSLMKNRQRHSMPLNSETSAVDLNAFQKQEFPEVIPLRVRTAFKTGLANALGRMTNGSTAEINAAIAQLKQALEPRIDFRGNELPYLSFGDLLRKSF